MTDRRTVQIVVGGLVALSLAMLALVGLIAVHDTPGAVPEALWTLLGGSVGALSAMLARTSVRPDPEDEEPPAPTTSAQGGRSGLGGYGTPT